MSKLTGSKFLGRGGIILPFEYISLGLYAVWNHTCVVTAQTLKFILFHISIGEVFSIAQPSTPVSTRVCAWMHVRYQEYFWNDKLSGHIHRLSLIKDRQRFGDWYYVTLGHRLHIFVNFTSLFFWSFTRGGGGFFTMASSRWALFEAICKGLDCVRTLSKFLVALIVHLGPQYLRIL
jgi:hypothetical protein